ncbi:uncharacterized protein LOC132891482 isoform X2 [Neoarius graeffei]|nr:uncharacterized protein LOC132891482 isoform X2 [Neoarius graeffei]
MGYHAKQVNSSQQYARPVIMSSARDGQHFSKKSQAPDSSQVCEGMKTETSDGEISEVSYICVKEEEVLELNISNQRNDLNNPPEVLSIKEEEPDSKDYLYCEDCKSFFFNKCEVHGTPLFIRDTLAPMGVPDRVRQTLPPGLEIRESSIPDIGLGAFNKGETVPIGAHFGPYKGELVDGEEAMSSEDFGVVQHSQRLNDPPVRSWVVVAKNNAVECCHCTCMAGRGETCSHDAAMLFAVETAVNTAQKRTCTDMSCAWIKPSAKKFDSSETADIDFSSQQLKHRKRMKLPEDTEMGETMTKKAVPPPTPEECSSFYANLAKNGAKCAVFTILPGYCNRFSPRSVTGDLPNPLNNLYNPDDLVLSYDELCNKSREVFESLKVSDVQISTVEAETRKQSSNKMWFQQRAGRITASVFKAAARTSPANPSRSLIMRICYPQNYEFSTAATRWGCSHEETAREKYVKHYSQCHRDFTVQECGLFLSKEYPYLGASPDGIVECTCCGKGCVEIKCPCCVKDEDMDVSEKSTFCLGKDDEGNLFLKKDHAYYFQIQSQMNILNFQYCDFIFWQGNGWFVQRVQKDVDFFQMQVAKVREFYINGVLLELLGKYFSEAQRNSSSTDPENIWCYCRKADSGVMLNCESGRCKIRRFHMSCLGLKRMPKGTWHCLDCKKLASKTKS